MQLMRLHSPQPSLRTASGVAWSITVVAFLLEAIVVGGVARGQEPRRPIALPSTLLPGLG